MRKITRSNTNIQCLEVLIPKDLHTDRTHHLLRTLALYSLHNHPVKSIPSNHNEEIFHFMVFDWNRTIKALLDDRKVHYRILQYFSPDTIYYDTLVDDLSEAVHDPFVSGQSETAESVLENAGLILEGRDD